MIVGNVDLCHCEVSDFIYWWAFRKWQLFRFFLQPTILSTISQNKISVFPIKITAKAVSITRQLFLLEKTEDTYN